MRLAALTVLALAAAGCASPARSTAPLDPAIREAMLLTRHDLAPGRHCDVVDARAPLPSIATVLDTAALPDYLRQAGAGADSGYGLFSVRFDSTGRAVRARLIEATFADSLRRPMEDVVASALVARAPGKPLAVRVRIDLGPTPGYRIGKSEYCRAVHESSGPSPVPMFDPALTPVNRPAEKINYALDISTTGEVMDVRFVPSIAFELDRAIRPWLMTQHWKPAIDDGLPVASEVKGSAVLEMSIQARPVGR